MPQDSCAYLGVSKIGVPYFRALIIRILLSRVLYYGPANSHFARLCQEARGVESEPRRASDANASGPRMGAGSGIVGSGLSPKPENPKP